MSEIVFLIEEDPEGGFTARALGHSIFTQADTWAALQGATREATLCHFENGEAPAVISFQPSFATANQSSPIAPEARSMGCPG